MRRSIDVLRLFRLIVDQRRNASNDQVQLSFQKAFANIANARVLVASQRFRRSKTAPPKRPPVATGDAAIALPSRHGSGGDRDITAEKFKGGGGMEPPPCMGNRHGQPALGPSLTLA